MENLKFDTKRSRATHCPCGKTNKDGKFVPFVGQKEKGYCFSCGQKFLPELEPGLHFEQRRWQSLPKKHEYFYLPAEYIDKAVGRPNNLLNYLSNTFGEQAAIQATMRYKVGAADKQNKGGTVFFYVDYAANICRGKIMLFDALTGKRCKDADGRAIGTNSIHAMMGKSDVKPPEPLFGEHLLANNPKQVIGITESEKTCIAASICFSEIIWLSVGGASMLTPAKMGILKGRKIILYPDIDKMVLWQTKAEELRTAGFNVLVSEMVYKDRAYLHPNADLLDWLLWKKQNKNTYPSQWDLPCERNDVNDYWRTVNALENLEGAALRDDKPMANAQIDILTKLHPSSDIPNELIKRHAPTCWERMD